MWALFVCFNWVWKVAKKKKKFRIKSGRYEIKVGNTIIFVLENEMGFPTWLKWTLKAIAKEK